MASDPDFRLQERVRGRLRHLRERRAEVVPATMTEPPRYILLLEDDSNRAALFFQRFTEADRARTSWAVSAAEAIDLLEQLGDVFDRIYLDHDLGDSSSHQDSRSDLSGMAVVRWLGKNRFRNVEGIQIHSWNLPAARRMKEALEAAGYEDVTRRPFGT